jgi:hypothetical protein
MSSSKGIRIAFLLGSGISIPAGLPSTSEITKRVLSGERVMRHSDGNYYFGDPLYAHVGLSDEYVPRVLMFLARLKPEIDMYYFDHVWRSTNYEDLYYVASQIHDSELAEYDNPAVQPLIDKISPDIQPLLRGRKWETRRKWELHELASEAMYYIQDVVWHMLSKEPTSLAHLSSLKEACDDSEVSQLDVFTTNHDTILERTLSEKGQQITDGFGKPTSKVRYWSPDLFETESFKVRLFKLHGSVNWFRLRLDGGDWSDESFAIPLDYDFRKIRNPRGQRLRAIDGRPLLLVGTFNKMLEYLSGIYIDLHYWLYRSLRHAQALVVSGYGFGDKGINNRIIEWIYSSGDHRITIIHPKPEKLRRAAMGAISNKWDDWLHQDKLCIIPKAIERTSWHDIRKSLFKTEASGVYSTFN